jgi:hypothetical protein
MKCKASLVAETSALISASHVDIATVLPSTPVYETGSPININTVLMIDFLV